MQRVPTTGCDRIHILGMTGIYIEPQLQTTSISSRSPKILLHQRFFQYFQFIQTLPNVIKESLYIPEKRYAELQAQGQVPVKGDILVTSRGKCPK